MISHPKNGWSKLVLDGFCWRISYLTDAPVNILKAFISRRKNDFGMVWFDGEGLDCALVLTPNSVYVIQEYPLGLMNFSHKDTDVLELELIHDIESDFTDWVEWPPDVSNDEKVRRESELLALLNELKELRQRL